MSKPVDANKVIDRLTTQFGQANKDIIIKDLQIEELLRENAELKANQAKDEEIN